MDETSQMVLSIQSFIRDTGYRAVFEPSDVTEKRFQTDLKVSTTLVRALGGEQCFTYHATLDTEAAYM